MTSPNLTEGPRSESSGESNARPGHPPTSMHTPDEYKALESPNEQGYTDLSHEMKGLFGSSEYATTPSPPQPQPHSKLVQAHRAVRGSLGPTRTGTGDEPSTTRTSFPFTKRPPLANPTEQDAETDTQSTPPERNGGLSMSGQSVRFQGRQPRSVTPPGAPLSLKHTTSISTAGHHQCQQPPQPAYTGSDTPRLRPPIGHPLSSSRDISGHDCGTLREDDTHAPGETVVRPSGLGARLYPPELPPPASSFPPHRPSGVRQAPPQPRPTVTGPNQAGSKYAWPTSDFNSNTINRRVDQPARECGLTTFLMHGSGLSRS